METKKILQCLAFTAVFLAVFVAGFFYGIDGAKNIVRFYVWTIALPLAFVATTDNVTAKAAAAKRNPAWVRYFQYATAWFALVIFVWFGYYFTAAAWGLQMFVLAVARERVKQIREKADPANLDA